MSVTQQIDLRGSVGKMVASILLDIAEIELEYRRERQAAGIRLAKRRGLYRGRKGDDQGVPSARTGTTSRGLTAAEIASALDVSLRTVFRYFAAA